jgi:hypothetical protein
MEGMESDPSVLDMIKAIQPLMGPLQEKLDRILYPTWLTTSPRCANC